MTGMNRSVLSEVKILDLTQGAAGPLCTLVLGNFGARIIKVEPPQGDWGRTLGPPFIDGESVIYTGFNYNKKSIVVDLKKKEGINVLKRLASECDVVVESFRPGVMDRLGIGFEDLKKINEAVIYCSISSYGQSGPWKDKPGVDGVIQAVSGMMSTLGTDEGEPMKVTNPIVDYTAGLMASQGILMALIAAGKYGVGQRIDVNLYDAALMVQRATVSSYLSSGELPKKVGSGAPYACPNESYATKDGHVMLAAYSPVRWRALCKLLGKEELLCDQRFLTNENRVAHRKELKAILEDCFKGKTTMELCKEFEDYDLICAPVSNYDDVFSLERLQANKLFKPVEHKKIGELMVMGVPIEMSFSPGGIMTSAPLLGEHTREILSDFNFSEEEIFSLEDMGVITAR